MKYILSALIAGFVLVGGIFIGHQPTAPTAGSFQPVQASQFTLAGAGITNSQTTVQLTSFLLPDPNKTPITMSMFGSIGYAVIDPQSSKIENISFTGVTQNANGSATLTGVSRGLSFYTPYAASSTLGISHAGGSTLILSNSAAFYGQQFLFANNIGSSTATLSFSNTAPPMYYPGPGAQSSGAQISTTSEFASVAYVNATAVSGAPNATEAVKGISQLATALQQASSTSLGSTAASLVLQAKYATDTPQSACASGFSAAGSGCNIVATLAGKIRQTWLDIFTTVNTWTSLNTFSAGFLATASSTHTATTTIPASNVNNNALVLNGIKYAFPSTQVATNTILETNGSGSLTWESLATQVATTSTNGTITITSSSNLSIGSTTIPGNYLGTNNEVDIYIPITNYSNGTSQSSSINVNFGGSDVATICSPDTATAVTGLHGYIFARLITNNNTGTEYIDGYCHLYTPATLISNGIVFFDSGRAAATVDSTANQQFGIDFQWAGTTGSPTASFSHGFITGYKR